MEKIEIGYNKTYLTLFVIGLVISLLGMNYITFFTPYFEDRYKQPFIWKIVAVALSLYCIIAIRKFFI